MSNSKKIFGVKAVQQDSKNADKKHYPDVGTFILHESGESGTLFLNHLPGIAYAVFLKDRKEREADDRA